MLTQLFKYLVLWVVIDNQLLHKAVYCPGDVTAWSLGAWNKQQRKQQGANRARTINKESATKNKEQTINKRNKKAKTENKLVLYTNM